MNVHAFMIELDQKDYWYPRKINNCENLCTKSMESNPLVISHILAEFHPERATITSLINGLSKSAQTFTDGFLKLLSTHPNPHCCLGKLPLYPVRKTEVIRTCLCGIPITLTQSYNPKSKLPSIGPSSLGLCSGGFRGRGVQQAPPKIWSTLFFIPFYIMMLKNKAQIARERALKPK